MDPARAGGDHAAPHAPGCGDPLNDPQAPGHVFWCGAWRVLEDHDPAVSTLPGQAPHWSGESREKLNNKLLVRKMAINLQINKEEFSVLENLFWKKYQLILDIWKERLRD